MNFDIVNVILTSLSMSVDAMTVGAIDGLEEKDMKMIKVILIALTFGLFQAIMPIIGYFIGFSFKDVLETYIPYIAFALLLILSIKSLIDFIKELKERKKQQENIDSENNTNNGNNTSVTKTKKIKVTTILFQGVATSIDALCIGFVFLDYDIPSAMLTFGIIGITTFILTLLTTTFGSKLASKLEKWASLIASIVFLAIGLKILIEGLIG